LRERNILVRHFAKPRISDFLRISIGADEECAPGFRSQGHAGGL